MSLVEVSGLRKSYGDSAVVDDLSFHVESGEIFGLLGPNGAGKTTAMMILAGVRQADGGTVRIGDQLLTADRRQAHRVLGLVPQEVALYPDLTGRENLQFFGAIYGLRGAPLQDRVDHLLDQTGLREHSGHYVSTYSGGMKRRLNFGAALLHQPQLVILDEPTVGVDPQSRAHLLKSVQQLAAEGAAVIYATHYMEEAQAICHRVAIIDHGRMLTCGTPEDLLDAGHSSICLRVRVALPAVRERLDGEVEVEPLEGNEVRLTVRRTQNEPSRTIIDRLSAVLERLATAHAELVSIETRDHNLEELFLELTGRNLRE